MKKLIFFAFLLSFTTLFAQEPAVPKLWGTRVHDEAGILSQPFVNRLEQQLKAYEDSTSNQVAVLIVRGLNGFPIEMYSIRVVEEWKLGTAEKDNGVLLLVAVDDRKIRIEVGDGLEGVLPDAVCNQIIRNEISPGFRQNNYEGGIDAGIRAMIQAIGGEYHADKAPRGRRDRGSIWGFLIILAIIFLISRIGGGGRGNYRRGGWSSGAGWYGGGFSGRGFGGGFSGGGGGFSGGGSSGSW